MNAETLHQFPLFANLRSSVTSALLETLEECVFPPGAVLFEEGSRTPYFYLLVDGEVEIVKSLGTADERVVAVSKTGALLGEMSLFIHDGAHTASVRAHTPLKLLRITFDQFEQLLSAHPRLAYDLVRLYSNKLEESEGMTVRELREKNRQLTQAYLELKAAQAVMIEKEKLEHELQLASEIQRRILPDELPRHPGLDFGALMIPARLIGGDFYDFIVLDKHRVAVVVGDVCDKGVPAALLMALTYSAIRAEAFRHKTPGGTLRAVNTHLLQINNSDLYVTVLYGILDCRTCEFSYARAGHPAPLVLDGQNQPVPVPVHLGQPVSLFEEVVIDEASVTIPPGGTLLAYSDGLSETVEGQAGILPLPQFCSALLEEEGLTSQGLCDRLWQRLGGSTAESLIQDDFTVAALRRLKPA